MLTAQNDFNTRLLLFFYYYYSLPLLRFRSALHCGYSGITDIQEGLFLS